MHHGVRIALFLTSAGLSWALRRNRASPLLWGYFLVGTYSAAAFRPYEFDWWTHSWIWIEPIRMLLRTAVTVSIYMGIRSYRMESAKISGLIAASFCIPYRITMGPELLTGFMAIRTYWLMFMWLAIFVTALCLWRIGEKIPHRLTLWCAAMFCYAASAVTDWNVSTGTQWTANTNLWSSALSGILLLWMIKEYLDKQKNHERSQEPDSIRKSRRSHLARLSHYRQRPDK